MNFALLASYCSITLTPNLAIIATVILRYGTLGMPPVTSMNKSPRVRADHQQGTDHLARFRRVEHNMPTAKPVPMNDERRIPLALLELDAHAQRLQHAGQPADRPFAHSWHAVES